MFSESVSLPKWLYPLAFAFLLLIIFSDAGGAGSAANGFAGFLGDIFGAVGDFVIGLIQGPTPKEVKGSGLPALDRGAIPEIYTGQTVDLDGDGVPEIAMFGDPKSPILQPLATPGQSSVDIAVGFATVVSAVTPVAVAAWKLSRPWWNGRQKKPVVPTTGYM